MSAKLVIDNVDPKDLRNESDRRYAHIGGARYYDEIEELGPPRYGAPGAKRTPKEVRRLEGFASQERVRLETFATRYAEDLRAGLAANSPPDLADFADGFAAGYNADAKHRAVLGSSDYRLGHAEGVRAAHRRRQRALHARDSAVWRWVGIVLAVLLGLGLGMAARADTLTDWQQLNELCQGGSGATAGKACTQRQKAVTRLRAEGWYQGAHGVWVSPAQVATFYRIVRHYDAAARANVGMLDKVMEGMMAELRAAVPPEAIFALWNGSAGELLATTPYAAALLMHGLPYLERTLSGRNDPRFVMVLRP